MAIERALTKNYLTFVAGLITEASPLTFPENAAKDLDNIDLIRDGSIRRRLGLEQDDPEGYSQLEFTREELATYSTGVYTWRSVAGDGSLNFLVVHVGPYLIFHDGGQEAVADTAVGYIDFSEAAIRSDFAKIPVSLAQGRGRLFVANKLINPFFVTYDQNANTFEGHPLTIQIRDMEGLDEQDDNTSVVPSGQETPPDPIQVPRLDFNLPFTSLTS